MLVVVVAGATFFLYRAFCSSGKVEVIYANYKTATGLVFSARARGGDYSLKMESALDCRGIIESILIRWADYPCQHEDFDELQKLKLDEADYFLASALNNECDSRRIAELSKMVCYFGSEAKMLSREFMTKTEKQFIGGCIVYNGHGVDFLLSTSAALHRLAFDGERKAIEMLMDNRSNEQLFGFDVAIDGKSRDYKEFISRVLRDTSPFCPNDTSIEYLSNGPAKDYSWAARRLEVIKTYLASGDSIREYMVELLCYSVSENKYIKPIIFREGGIPKTSDLRAIVPGQYFHASSAGHACYILIPHE